MTKFLQTAEACVNVHSINEVVIKGDEIIIHTDNYTYILHSESEEEAKKEFQVISDWLIED